jgi:hypothetical protein
MGALYQTRIADDRVGVLRHHLRGLGVCPIEEELDGRRLLPFQCRLKAFGNDEGQIHASALKGGVDVVRGNEGGGKPEIAALDEAVDKAAARRRPVAIQNPKRDVLDVERNRVAKEKEHDQRHQNGDCDRDRIAPELPRLLGDDGGDPLRIHEPPLGLAPLGRFVECARCPALCLLVNAGETPVEFELPPATAAAWRVALGTGNAAPDDSFSAGSEPPAPDQRHYRLGIGALAVLSSG